MSKYSAKITVTTKMPGNGDVQKKVFNGKRTLGLKGKGSIAKRAEAYLQAVSKSQGAPPKGKVLTWLSSINTDK